MRWRLAVPLATAAGGLLLATTYAGSDGTDLRAGDRRIGLSGLVAQNGDQVEVLQSEVGRLQQQVERLSQEATSRPTGGADARREATVAALRDRTGLRPVGGPGLTVVLDDAPDQAIDAVADDVAGSPVTVSDLVVHQQDIQAVANALWRGGAEAMTIRGQRVVATTGIKCVGNTVILHGVPYSPPYDISAVGDPAALRTALEESAYVTSYREVADAYDLGYVVLPEQELQMPAYTGSTQLQHARAAQG